MTNREVMERWFEELWGKRNWKIIDEMVDPDCKIYGLPGASHGPSGFRPFVELFGAAFPEVEIRVDEAVEAGDRVAVRCSGHVIGRDGKRHPLTGGGIVRVRGGKFIEAWNQWDFLGLLIA